MTELISKLSTLSPMNVYRAIKTMREGLRRSVSIERNDEDREHLNGFDRLTAVAMGRDLNRNSSKAITILNQRAALTVAEVKAQFNSSDPDWNKAANFYFNNTFARDCYYRTPEHLAQVAEWVELAKIREGDILVVFDDFLTGSGKLLLWEADQLVSVVAGDWEQQTLYCDNTPDGKKAMFQQDGVVRDQFGKVVAYTVIRDNPADKNTRGRVTAPLADVTIVPAESARVVRHTVRPGQVRGVPVLLPVSDDLADIEDMVKSELATAKTRSKIMAFVKHSAEEMERIENKAFLKAIAERTGEDNTEDQQVVKRSRYRQLEEGLGGIVEYCDDGDTIDIPGVDRPNLDVGTFFNFAGDNAGAALGLAQGYTRMAVAGSYTAHRGETCLTFRHIRREQKKHEHDWLDWLAVKVVEFAIDAGKLPAGPESWQGSISWRMPSADVIDPQKEAAAEQQDMKNGKRNLRDIIGPDWKEKLEETAEILAFAREKGVPLSMFETVAGAAAEIGTELEEEQ